MLTVSVGSIAALQSAASAQSTTRASISATAVQGNKPSGNGVSISANGRYVAFGSEATTLVPLDTNGRADIFVHDRFTQTTERVSISTTGAEADADCDRPSISADGRYVAFSSLATTLAPDGGLVPDVFLHDRVLHTTEKISTPVSGVETTGSSLYPSISADGRFVAFESTAKELGPSKVSWYVDIFVRDRLLGTTEIVSVTSAEVPSTYYSQSPSISADGRFVAFIGPGQLVPGPGVFSEGLYVLVRDRVAGTTVLVGKNTAGQPADQDSNVCGISADGRFVAFSTGASNLGGGSPLYDVFLHDTSTGVTSCVSTNSQGNAANNGCYFNSISGDGQIVVFGSAAGNLVPNDTNAKPDVFAKHVSTNATTRLSVADDGAQANDDSNGQASASSDGSVIAFVSVASNLVVGDTNGWQDVFLRTVVPDDPWSDMGNGVAGQAGVPVLSASGMLWPGAFVDLKLSGCKPFSSASFVVGTSLLSAPFKGGVMVPDLDLVFPGFTNFFGALDFGGLWPNGIPSGTIVYFQWWIQDPGGPKGFAASNAVAGTTP